MCESLTDVRNHSPPGAETGVVFLAKTSWAQSGFLQGQSPPPAEVPCLPHSALHLNGQAQIPIPH